MQKLEIKILEIKKVKEELYDSNMEKEMLKS